MLVLTSITNTTARGSGSCKIGFTRKWEMGFPFSCSEKCSLPSVGWLVSAPSAVVIIRETKGY